MIIGVAATLGMRVVAEGVETKEQFEILKELHCQEYQGYLCSKPLPSLEFEKLFLRHHCS